MFTSSSVKHFMTYLYTSKINSSAEDDLENLLKLADLFYCHELKHQILTYQKKGNTSFVITNAEIASLGDKSEVDFENVCRNSAHLDSSPALESTFPCTDAVSGQNISKRSPMNYYKGEQPKDLSILAMCCNDELQVIDSCVDPNADDIALNTEDGDKSLLLNEHEADPMKYNDDFQEISAEKSPDMFSVQDDGNSNASYSSVTLVGCVSPPEDVGASPQCPSMSTPVLSLVKESEINFFCYSAAKKKDSKPSKGLLCGKKFMDMCVEENISLSSRLKGQLIGHDIAENEDFPEENCETAGNLLLTPEGRLSRSPALLLVITIIFVSTLFLNSVYSIRILAGCP